MLFQLQASRPTRNVSEKRARWWRREIHSDQLSQTFVLWPFFPFLGQLERLGTFSVLNEPLKYLYTSNQGFVARCNRCNSDNKRQPEVRFKVAQGEFPRLESFGNQYWPKNKAIEIDKIDSVTLVWLELISNTDNHSSTPFTLSCLDILNGPASTVGVGRWKIYYKSTCFHHFPEPLSPVRNNNGFRHMFYGRVLS